MKLNYHARDQTEPNKNTIVYTSIFKNTIKIAPTNFVYGLTRFVKDHKQQY